MPQNNKKKIKKPADPLIGRQAKPTILDNTTKLDIDTEKQLADAIIYAGIANKLDASELDKFTSISNARDQVYQLIDTMCNDSAVSSIVRTYAEDATETADNGHIVWCESKDEDVSKFVNYLLNVMNVDKNIYSWVYSLVKYGDCYLRLYRESDYEDKLFNRDRISKADTASRVLNEDINLNIHSANDAYSYYVEMVPNPGTMYELTRFGKTFGYIETPDAKYGFDYSDIYTGTSQANGSSALNYNYRYKSSDVNIYQADDFVHACLEDDVSRYPETVNLYLTEDDYNSNLNSTSYTVRRGKSLLYDAYKIWREKQLLEAAALLSRITRSGLVRKVSVEVGDMPKNQVMQTLREVKTLFEQKSAIQEGQSFAEYTNPGAVENFIYVPTHNGQGNISVESIGGDYDPKQLTDLDWWNNKFYASFGIPKQYFGYCLRGNTKIKLLNGEAVEIAKMAEEPENYIGKGIMGCAADGSLVPTTITNVCMTKPEATFLRIHLDNGEYVDVTPEHRMMLRAGTFVEAKDLTVGTSLMPFYTSLRDDGLYTLDNKAGKYRPQFQLVAEAKYGELKSGHRKYLLENCHDRIRYNRKIRLFDTEEIVERKLSQVEYDAYLNKAKLYWSTAAGGRGHSGLAASYALYCQVERNNELYEAARASMGTKTLSFNCLLPWIEKLDNYVPEVNHLVTAIEVISDVEPAYDLTVADDCHTFPLEAGIFVHNCDDGAGFNGGSSLTIISSVYAKAVKRIQNAIIQAITDAINLILLNKGLRSYLNAFVLRMKAPVTQEEKDYRESLTNRINVISNMLGLFNDVETRSRKLIIVKDLVAQLHYGDDILEQLQKEIDLATAQEEAAAKAAEAEGNDSPPADDMSEVDLNEFEAANEAFVPDPDSEQITEDGNDVDFLVESNEDLPTPEEADDTIDFTEVK